MVLAVGSLERQAVLQRRAALERLVVAPAARRGAPAQVVRRALVAEGVEAVARTRR